MINTKSNAFTLIELLAVILILGIIALIAIPTVNKVLEESKIGAFKSTVNNLTQKARETCNLELIKGKGITRRYTIIDGEISSSLEIKGNIPDGEINLDSKCNVTYELTDNKYRAVKGDESSDSTINKCSKNCLSYSEPILNGAKPVLSSGMIPVTIETDGTVKKADIYSNWYNYENKEWANMVLVTDSTRENYKKIEPGTIITNSDILGYFVWILRYKYKIPTGGTATPSTIDIVFENNTTTKSSGNATSEYLTHPGFTFGSDELNGIWVAKFETTGTATTPTVLPNVSSLRSQTISKQFEIALKFNDYGINRDSHMMKNSEWGTVAYLSHSEYGIKTKIRINNNSNRLTGCGANDEGGAESTTCEIEYGSGTNDLPQSTTGNITGIFDMSGGSRENVMANYNKGLAFSEFSELPDSKYYDLYSSDDYSIACNLGSCLGHALLETLKWYGNYSNSIDSKNTWVYRGGNFTHLGAAGIFMYSNNQGGPYESFTFRTVIV